MASIWRNLLLAAVNGDIALGEASLLFHEHELRMPLDSQIKRNTNVMAEPGTDAES